jgi:dedicator of cytokinesis protein 1
LFKDYIEAAIGGANGRSVSGGSSSSLPLSAAELKRRTDKLAQALHSLPFLFKFVVKSRLLFAALNGGKGTEPFEVMLRDVLLSLVKLMFGGSQSDLLAIQAACLKHIVLTVPDLVQVFPRRSLAEILMKMMTSLPTGQLTEQKLDTLR